MTEIRVVLDTTALLAYANYKGMATAEIIMVVEEDDGASLIGVPAACYMQAHAQLGGDERGLLESLVTRADGVSVVLPLTGHDAIEAARLGHTMGHAVLEARRHRAHLATYDGAEARRHLPEAAVLDLVD